MPPFSPDYTVAIVDDEPILLEELGFQLRRHGFKVATFANAGELYRHLAVNPRVVAVLDIGLPGEDGLSICRYLREHDKRLGIVFVSARGRREERMEGLAAGADAYLPKPVDLDELVLVLRRLGERFVPEQPIASRPEVSGVVAAGGWKVDLSAAQVVSPRAGIEVALTLQELLIVRALVRAAPEVCTTQELGKVLGMQAEDLDKHRIEVIVSRLRTKIGRQTGEAFPLRARRGMGYYLSIGA